MNFKVKTLLLKPPCDESICSCFLSFKKYIWEEKFWQAMNIFCISEISKKENILQWKAVSNYGQFCLGKKQTFLWVSRICLFFVCKLLKVYSEILWQETFATNGGQFKSLSTTTILNVRLLHSTYKCQLHQCFTSSFYTLRSQKRKKTLMTWQSFCAFVICPHKSCT